MTDRSKVIFVLIIIGKYVAETRRLVKQLVFQIDGDLRWSMAQTVDVEMADEGFFPEIFTLRTFILQYFLFRC